MTARGYNRGHEIVFSVDDGIWVYADTRQPVPLNPFRKCGHCNKPSTPEGHDPCIGTLPGVINACCGHGDDDQAYVQHIGGATVSGAKAARILFLAREGIGPEDMVRDPEDS